MQSCSHAHTQGAFCNSLRQHQGEESAQQNRRAEVARHEGNTTTHICCSAASRSDCLLRWSGVQQQLIELDMEGRDYRHWGHRFRLQQLGWSRACSACPWARLERRKALASCIERVETQDAVGAHGEVLAVPEARELSQEAQVHLKDAECDQQPPAEDPGGQLRGIEVPAQAPRMCTGARITACARLAWPC